MRETRITNDGVAEVGQGPTEGGGDGWDGVDGELADERKQHMDRPGACEGVVFRELEKKIEEGRGQTLVVHPIGVDVSDGVLVEHGIGILGADLLDGDERCRARSPASSGNARSRSRRCGGGSGRGRVGVKGKRGRVE